MILWYCILIFLCYVIPYKLAIVLAKKIGYFMYFTFYRNRRRYVFENLKTIKGRNLSSNELHRLAIETYENFCVFIYEFLILPSMYKKGILKSVRPVHSDRIKTPSLMLAAHLGNWEWGAATLAGLGFCPTIIARRHPYKYVTGLFTRRRRAAGVEVVYLGEGVRKILNTLKEGNIVATLGDRDYTGNYLPTRFMGRVMAIPRGLFEIRLRTNVPIIPTFCLKEKGGYKIYFEPALKSSSLKDTVDEWIKIVEKYVKRYPTQWYIFDDIWKGL